MTNPHASTRTEALVSTREYYEAAVTKFGASSRGVDWPTQHGQVMRFQALDKVWDGLSNATLCDFGCGYGAYLAHLRAAGFVGSYIGIDLSPQMIRFAAEKSSRDKSAIFLVSDEPHDADFVVASGIFNVVTSGSRSDWEIHTQNMLDGMCAAASVGLAFNALLEPTPPFKVRDELYWIDPNAMLDELTRRGFSPALVTGYGLHEATYIARRT